MNASPTDEELAAIAVALAALASRPEAPAAQTPAWALAGRDYGVE